MLQNLEQLYEELFPKAAAMVRRWGGDLAQAKDLFHDAMLIYLEKSQSPSFHIESTPQAYIIGIVRILWYRQCKTDYTRPLPPDIIDEAEETEEPRSVTDYLKMAGQKCWQLLTSFYIDQSSMQEIAGQMGFNSARSATVQKHKCLEKIRSAIQKNEAHAVAV